MKDVLQHAKYSGAQPTACPFGALSYTHQCQAPIIHWAPVPTPDYDHHSCHNLQHRSGSPPDSWTNWCPLWCLQVTGRQMMQIPLHPCMPASPLWCTTPSVRSESLPLWYLSCSKDSYQVHTSNGVVYCIAWDDTSMNTVSSPLTLSQMSQQPHWQAPARPHISAPLPAPFKPAQLHTVSTCCTCNACNSKTTDTSCPQSWPCACTYVCNTQHSSCAAL